MNAMGVMPSCTERESGTDAGCVWMWIFVRYVTIMVQIYQSLGTFLVIQLRESCKYTNSIYLFWKVTVLGFTCSTLTSFPHILTILPLPAFLRGHLPYAVVQGKFYSK